MTRVLIATMGAALLTVGCSDPQYAAEPAPMADVEVAAEAESAAPAPAPVATPAPAASPRPRTTTAAAQAPAKAPAPAPRPQQAAPPAPAVPEYREVLIPAGTALALRLASAVASDTSQVEDPVQATLRSDLVVDGVVLPAGSELAGHVVDAERSGRVRGRARVAFQFNTLRFNGDVYDVRTDTVERVAEATKGEDAAKIGVGAGAGAVLGAILGGGGGAAKGAAIGGAAGTGAVLATRGDEVRLEPGEPIDATLAAPLTVRVRVR